MVKRKDRVRNPYHFESIWFVPFWLSPRANQPSHSWTILACPSISISDEANHFPDSAADEKVGIEFQSVPADCYTTLNGTGHLLYNSLAFSCMIYSAIPIAFVPKPALRNPWPDSISFIHLQMPEFQQMEVFCRHWSVCNLFQVTNIFC